MIVVDAMHSGLPAGTVRRFDANVARLPAGSVASSHAMGIGEAVELARTLNRPPSRLTVYGIEAADVTLGAPPSDAVAAAADRLASRSTTGSGAGDMCVALPGRVAVGETELNIDLMLVPDVDVGDHVVVHSAFAISIVPADEATSTLKLLRE